MGAERGAPPLSELLIHAAAAVAAVRAGRSLTEVLGEAAGPPPRLRPGVQALASHTLRRLGMAQALRQRLVPRPPPLAADALLLTALALLPLDGALADDAPRYEPHTVVDQAVRAAKRAAAPQAGLINAVLRRALREAAALAAAVQADPVARWNHPAWWIQRLQRDWPERWQAVLAQNNGRAPMTLRVNTRQHRPADYLARLHAAGIGARLLGEAALVLDQPVPVERLPGWTAGAVSVQDAAAQLAAPLLLTGRPAGWDGPARPEPGDASPAGPPAPTEAGAHLHASASGGTTAADDRNGPGNPALTASPNAPLPPGARVLDACAAPGGKTAHLLEQADLDILALDLVPARLTRVADNLRRLRLAEVRQSLAEAEGSPFVAAGAPEEALLVSATEGPAAATTERLGDRQVSAGSPPKSRATVLAADAARPATWWDGRPFDAILLDAPCSASGIVRRHPDVRWLRRESDLQALAATQDALLDALWPLLAPGGRLVYCTCSVFKVEGQERVDAFLQRTPGARLLASPGHIGCVADNPATGPTGPAVPPPAAAIPGAFDGFFYAVLHKPPGPAPDPR